MENKVPKYLDADQYDDMANVLAYQNQADLLLLYSYYGVHSDESLIVALLQDPKFTAAQDAVLDEFDASDHDYGDDPQTQAIEQALAVIIKTGENTHGK